MSSIEDSMSSGSRVRQFGLYRTIDARTEEFLRLSRKRQIRQGCACAAASTAITVTIVIVVFFVYEFSLNSSTQLQKSLKYNWLSLINDTEDGTSFDPKLTKASIDRTTLKLLPLLLKAIKKNAALEKLFDDQTNLLSENEEKNKNDHDTNTYDHNVRTDWIKKPTTHLFAVDHKTLPIIFYKDPTKNIELYTKIRKIRDYQRVFKYVDKMINEKVYVRSTRPMQPDTTNRPFTTQKVTFKNNTKKLSNTIIKNITKTNEKPKYTCKCAQNLKDLLNKILSNFEKIIPELKRNKMKPAHLECHKSMKSFSTTPKHTIEDMLIKLPPYTSSEKSIQTTAVPLYKTNIFESDESEQQETKDSNHISEPKDLNVLSKEYMKTFIDTRPIKSTVIDKFDQIMNQKQVLKRHEMKATTKLEPIFDGLEYNDYDYNTTPSSKKSAIINYVKTKLNYIRHAHAKKKAIKNNTENIYGDGKNISANNSMKIVDNKITLVKAKHKPKIKGVTDTNASEYFDNNFKTSFEVTDYTPLILNKSHTSIDSREAEKQIISNLFNSSYILKKYFETDLIKNSTTDAPVLFYGETKKNTPKSSYFKYSTTSQETVYNILKNSVNTYLSNKSSKLNHSALPSNNDQIVASNLKPENSNKTSKSVTYRIIENHVNSLLHKNISTLKAIKEKYAFLPSVKERKKYSTTQNDNNVKTPESTTIQHEIISTMSEISGSSTEKYTELWTKFLVTKTMPVTKPPKPVLATEDLEVKHTGGEISETSDKDTQSTQKPIHEDSEFTNSELTKSPENAIHQPRSNLSEKQKESDLTWEDLTNEFMPAWRSMIRDPNKSIYFGFQKADEKNEEQEDYNINSNFYDLNL